jgi:Spy/CpxP family protein refolding chaperone
MLDIEIIVLTLKFNQMKTIKMNALLGILVMSLMLSVNLAQAQRGPGGGNRQGPANTQNNFNNGPQWNNMLNQIPDLTDNQKEQIKTLQTKMMKEILPLQNKLREEMAKFRTLTTAEKPDNKAIENQVEVIGKIKIDMMKIRTKFHQEIRTVLNDNQRLFFDMHSPRNFGNKGRGNCMMNNFN